MRDCPECGSEVAEIDGFCPYCGIALQQTAADKTESVSFSKTIIVNPPKSAEIAEELETSDESALNNLGTNQSKSEEPAKIESKTKDAPLSITQENWTMKMFFRT